MHLYMAGVGGLGISPLAQLAHELGYQISGSDIENSPQIEAMQLWQPKPHITIGQTVAQISRRHQQNPIDWYVYSSALAWVKPANPELNWVKQQSIKHSQRDVFLNYLLQKHHFKLLAVAGSHGKTTTTALLIWVLQQLDEKISYALGGKIINQPSAKIMVGSRWFIYEADEFDRNFLELQPNFCLISGLEHDHHEVYKTPVSYLQAFVQFVQQSKLVLMGTLEAQKLLSQAPALKSKLKIVTTQPAHPQLTLLGVVNRQNATLVLKAVQILKPAWSEAKIIQTLNKFPGCQRRFEKIIPNLYSDYAHNPVKISGCLQRAAEMKQTIVVVYEPHSNYRQHYIKNDYKNLFQNVQKLYWLPTYLAREDATFETLSPHDLISYLNNPEIAQAATMNQALKTVIESHLKKNQLVVIISAGKLDAWLRSNFKAS